MKKLAICFYGQPRFIDNKFVYNQYEQIKKRYSADIFIHSWISNSETNMNASDWAIKYNFIENKNADKQILQMYNPKKYLFEQPKKFTLNNTSREKIKSLPYYSTNNENNLLSHLTSYSNAIKLIDYPNDYEFLLVTRLDAILELPDLNEIKNDKFYLFGKNHSHWTDIAFLCGNKYISAFNAIDYIDELSFKISLFTAEEYKKYSYLKYFTLDDVIWLKNHGSGLVRSNNNLENIQI